MSRFLIVPEALAATPALKSLLVERGFDVDVNPQDAKAADIVICSAQFEGKEKRGTALARTLKARHLVIVREDADAFNVDPGALRKITVIDMPAGPDFVSMVADIVATQARSMVAADPATVRLLQMAARVAKSDVTVFINGPTGTGKEVLARHIHDNSPRAAKPFVAINCAAIPENMLEAVLFGHEKGAFTGAAGASAGLIRAAEGGTLLLDEISEMPLALQAKLLRVLQERAVMPLGSHKEIPVDVRVLATTNRNMAVEIQERRFREDLYYRLNVFPLETRPLSVRPGDIQALALALTMRHAQAALTPPLPTAAAMAELKAYAWPGNVRELENVIQRALVLCDGHAIEPQDLMFDATPSAMPMPKPALSARPMELAI